MKSKQIYGYTEPSIELPADKYVKYIMVFEGDDSVRIEIRNNSGNVNDIHLSKAEVKSLRDALKGQTDE